MVKKRKSNDNGNGNGNNQPRTYVQLQRYIDVLFNGLTSRFEDNIQSIKDSSKLSDTVMNERLNRMNEFREQINSERAEYVTKDMLDARLVLVQAQRELLVKEYDTRVKSLENKAIFTTGRGSIWGTILPIISVIISVVAVVFLYLRK